MSFLIHEKMTIATVLLTITNPSIVSITAAIITLIVSLNNLRKQVVEAGGWQKYLHNLKKWK